MSAQANYRFPERRTKGTLKETKFLSVAKVGESLPSEFDGKAVDSVEEARVGVALKSIGWDFEFHYPIFGGTGLRGGQVLDFLVYVVPVARPLYLQSSYWHHATKKPDDRLNIAWVAARTGGWWGPPAEIWDYEAKSVEQATIKLLGLFGRPG